MPIVSHALVTYAASPWQVMMKFVDGVGSIVDPFPVIPQHVIAPAWSRDGNFVLAAVPGSGTTPLKMWKRTPNGFEEVTLTGVFPDAIDIYSMCWYDNKHVLFCHNNIAANQNFYLGIFDGVDSFSITAISNPAPQSNLMWLNETTIATARFPGSANYSWRTLDPVAGTVSYENTSALMVTSGTTVALLEGNTLIYNNRNTTGGISSAKIAGKYLNIPAKTSTAFVVTNYPGTFSTSADEAVCKTRSNDAFIGITSDVGVISTKFRYGLNTWEALGTCLPGKWLKDDTITIPAIAAGIAEIGINKYAFGVKSAAAGGRVRAFSFNEVDSVVEDTTVAALFSSIAVPVDTFTASVIQEETEAGSSLYDAAIQRFLNDTVDLVNIKLLLVNDSVAFNGSATNITTVIGANEVYGSDWPQGGIDLDTLTIEKYGSGSQVAIKGVIPAFSLNSPGTITFRSAIIYDVTSSAPLIFVDFETDQTATQFDLMEFSATNSRLITFAQGG